MSELPPQPNEELMRLQRGLNSARADFVKHVKEDHPSGILPTSCHPCLRSKAEIRGFERRIQTQEMNAQPAPKKIARR